MKNSTKVTSDALVTQACNEFEKQDSFAVRKEVFIGEQKWPAHLVMDCHDLSENTVHFVAYHQSKPIGSARLRTSEDGRTGKIERVAVLKEARGLGIGRSLLREMESFALKRRLEKLTLNAQLHARAFYERLGYHPCGNVFITANIQHIEMEKELD